VNTCMKNKLNFKSKKTNINVLLNDLITKEPFTHDDLKSISKIISECKYSLTFHSCRKILNLISSTTKPESIQLKIIKLFLNNYLPSQYLLGPNLITHTRLNHLHIVKFLLFKFGNVPKNYRNYLNEGLTIAIKNKYYRIIKLLIQHGAQDHQLYLLRLALVRKQFRIAKLFLQNPNSLIRKGEDGYNYSFSNIIKTELIGNGNFKIFDILGPFLNFHYPHLNLKIKYYHHLILNYKKISFSPLSMYDYYTDENDCVDINQNLFNGRPILNFNNSALYTAILKNEHRNRLVTLWSRFDREYQRLKTNLKVCRKTSFIFKIY
jgi:hypothetical protein